jgi:hypothetical protein
VDPDDRRSDPPVWTAERVAELSARVERLRAAFEETKERFASEHPSSTLEGPRETDAHERRRRAS